MSMKTLSTYLPEDTWQSRVKDIKEAGCLSMQAASAKAKQDHKYEVKSGLHDALADYWACPEHYGPEFLAEIIEVLVDRL